MHRSSRRRGVTHSRASHRVALQSTAGVDSLMNRISSLLRRSCASTRPARASAAARRRADRESGRAIRRVERPVVHHREQAERPATGAASVGGVADNTKVRQHPIIRKPVGNTWDRNTQRP